jgi:hypothetical protein
MSRNFHLHDGKKGAALAVRVTPRSSRNEITEIQDDGTVKVRLTAAPNENQANEMLLKFLADILGVAPSKLDIVAGLTGKDKLISIIDMSSEDVQRRLLAHLS